MSARECPDAGERRLTGRAVLAIFIAFFGVVVTVNMLMLSLALDTMPGTTTESAYRGSQLFNSELAAAQERAARGWAVEAGVVRDASGAAGATVSVRDRDGGPVERIAVAARLEHPARRAADRHLDMARAGTGLHAGTAGDVPAGAYDLVVEVRRDGALMFRSRNRVILP
jgi:nitrogen fixation protein FixH